MAAGWLFGGGFRTIGAGLAVTAGAGVGLRAGGSILTIALTKAAKEAKSMVFLLDAVCGAVWVMSL